MIDVDFCTGTELSVVPDLLRELIAAEAKPMLLITSGLWKTTSITCLLVPDIQELFDIFHNAASDGYVGGLWTVTEILQLCLGPGD